MTTLRSPKWSAAIVCLLLLTWGLRLCCLEAVPPGWRDDELINIHALSGQVLDGRFPLYYTGASGHEPLYHHLHAGVHAVLGFNVLSGHLLSIALGLLTVALTYTLTHRLFGPVTAVIASLALTTSFWSLMYSRTAIRHISLPPLALAAFYLFWRSPANRRRNVLLGGVTGMALYTYPAARLLPLLVIAFLAYLALFHRPRFRRCWRGTLLALAIATLLAVPLGIAIARGRSRSAAQGIGADARLAELALPVRELRAGNPRPLVEYTWTTLGMFHATGDPEWLYNLPGRPVFNLLGGILLWAGVALCLYRWRRPRYFFLLLWLGGGLLPAFLSTPPASLSHTILAQPVAYVLPALFLTQAHRWLKVRLSKLKTGRLWSFVVPGLVFIFLLTNAARDLRDYFFTWPQRGMVGFLYRACYRDAAGFLDAHLEVTDVAISGDLMGPWNRLALEVDTRRDDVAVRLFDPARALVWAGENDPTTVLLTTYPRPTPPIERLLAMADESLQVISPHLRLYTLPPFSGLRGDAADAALASVPLARFANGLALTEISWLEDTLPAPGREGVLLLAWRVVAPLDLPPIPIVANPPPPGVYSGPRLVAFVHLLAPDGTFLTGDDGLWVDPVTLRPGDRFVQVHRLALPPDALAGPYTLGLGLYDPMTGERWPILQESDWPGPDYFLVPVEEAP